MRTAIVARVLTFDSANPDAECLRLNKIHRLGVGWAIVEDRPDGRHVVSAKVRVGSVAERYVMRRVAAS